MLSEQPTIDPSATVRGLSLGVWTQLDSSRTRAELEARFEDFRDMDVFFEKYLLG